MKANSLIRSGALILALALAPHPTSASNLGGAPKGDEGGAVFTMDNAAAANRILAYHRTPDGALEPFGSFVTGGRGTGAGLGNQGGLALSENGRWLFACNAGSDDVTVFLVTPRGLVRTDQIGARGRRPISLALHGNLLFVLNAGGQVGDQDGLAGFLLLAGKLHPLAHSVHALSADNTGPAQIGFSPDGHILVVTEKNTGVIDTFTVDNDGSIDEVKHFASAGQTPFGFAFRRQELIVTEAFGGARDASAASSYDLQRDGDLAVISPSVPTTESSACWAVVSGSGRFAYTANTGSGSISGFSIAMDGRLGLLTPGGVTGATGPDSSPADLAMSGDSRFLYSRNGDGTISAFRVNPDGSLTSRPGVTGISAGGSGLVAK